MTESICIKKNEFLTELSSAELSSINGGGFFGDLAYAISATAHFIVYAAIDGHKNPIRPSEYR